MISCNLKAFYMNILYPLHEKIMVSWDYNYLTFFIFKRKTIHPFCKIMLKPIYLIIPIMVMCRTNIPTD